MDGVSELNNYGLNPLAFTNRIGTYSVSKEISLLSFLQALFKKDPQVIFFGELHKTEPENYQPTLEHFAQEILPRLAKRGFTDLILEYIPDDPIIEKELEEFYKTGILDETTAPRLLGLISAFNYCAIRETLIKARELGIRVHGAYLNLEEINERIRSGNSAAAAGLITRHMLVQINELHQSGRKYIIYGGLAHNDLDVDSEEMRDINVGLYLDQLYSGRYFEVDLVVPESLADFTPEERSYVVPPNWRKLIPVRGITVIQHANSYLLFFPQSCQVETLDFTEFYACPLSYAPQCPANQ